MLCQQNHRYNTILKTNEDHYRKSGLSNLLVANRYPVVKFTKLQNLGIGVF